MNVTQKMRDEFAIRRKLSASAGDDTYIGRICPKHPESMGERRVSNTTCVGCRDENKRPRIILTKEQKKSNERKTSKEWYSKNKQHVMSRSRIWRLNNPDKVKQIIRKYNNSNKGRLLRKIQYHKRRYSSNGGTFTKKDWVSLLARQKSCYYCRKRFTKNLKPTVDHVIPLSKGGKNVRENVVAACFYCNVKKGCKILFLL